MANAIESNHPHQIGTYKVHFGTMPITGSTREIDDLLNQYFNYAKKNKKGVIERLLNLIEKYPHIPQFKNYLYMAYMNNERSEEATQLLLKTIEQHPDYFFAKVNLALQYIEEEKIAEAEALMGGAPTDIKNMYPERNEFHITEIISYQKYGFEYYLVKKDWQIAEIYLNNLNKFIPQRPELKNEIQTLKKQLTLHTITSNIQKHQEMYEKIRKVKSTPKQFFEPTDEPPVFNHAEIDNLYYHGVDMPNELISNILALPHPTLIQDLEMMLIDFQRRNTYYQEQLDNEDTDYHWQFFFHPIFLLAELQASDSLPAVLNIFRQDEEFSEYWFGDYIEDFLEPLYQLGQNQLPILAEYLKEENNYTWLRNIIAQVPCQVAIHQPTRRPEVIEWYREILTYFIDNQTNSNLIDGSLIGAMIGDILDIEGKELVSIIEQLYTLELADEMMQGNWETVQAEFVEHSYPVELQPVDAPIITLYNNILHRPPIKYVDEAKAAKQLEKIRKDFKEPDEDDLSAFAEIAGLLGLDNDDDEDNIYEKPTLKLRPQVNYGRNDKVTVKYKNGKIEKDVKFKKIEEDWQNGECDIIS